MRNLNRFRTAIYIAGSFLILFSCAKEPTEIERTPTSTFPLTTDSRWEYEGLWYTVPFNDLSLADTARKEIYRHIISQDSLEGIGELTVCDDTIIIGDAYIYRQWLKIEDHRLMLYAVCEFEAGGYPNPYLYDTPQLLLDFPLRTGKTWTAYTQSNYTENNTIVGIEYIELPSGWQYCDVVRGTVSNIITGDTIRQGFEWFNEDGLMRAEYDYGVSEVYDEFGVFLDSVRSYEIWELIELDIQP